MKKLSLILLTIVLIIGGSLGSVSIFAATNYTVKFYIDANNFVTQTVQANAAPTLPATPVKTGYSFKGWSLSADGATTVVNVLAIKVNEDVNFYAVFQINKYTVTFKYFAANGILTTSTQQVNYNDLPIAPDVPSNVNGSTFLGWDNDISTAITSNKTFTAQMNETYFVVKYLTADGAPIADEYYSGITDVSGYAAPTVDGKKFKGWSLSADGKIIDTNYRVSADTSLYAIYNTDILYQYNQLPIWAKVAIPCGVLLIIFIIVAAVKNR
ncbi:MAG: InlB B-repeat-containing protein [Clostridia bacterium]